MKHWKKGMMEEWNSEHKSLKPNIPSFQYSIIPFQRKGG